MFAPGFFAIGYFAPGFFDESGATPVVNYIGVHITNESLSSPTITNETLG